MESCIRKYFLNAAKKKKSFDPVTPKLGFTKLLLFRYYCIDVRFGQRHFQMRKSQGFLLNESGEWRKWQHKEIDDWPYPIKALAWRLTSARHLSTIREDGFKRFNDKTWRKETYKNRSRIRWVGNVVLQINSVLGSLRVQDNWREEAVTKLYRLLL